MKTLKYLFVLIAFGLMSYSANAQTELIYDGGVYQNNIKLTTEEVKELMKGDSSALSKYRSGKTQYAIGQHIFYPAIFSLGTGLYVVILESMFEGSFLYNADKMKMGLTLMAIGGVGMIIGHLIYNGGANKMKEAVKIYNTNINNNKVSVNFGFTGNGIGLNVRF